MNQQTTPSSKRLFDSDTQLMRASVMVVCLAFLFIFIWLPTVQAQSLVNQSRIEALYVKTQQGNIYIDVQVMLELTPAMQEALEKGVTLYFVATAEIERERWYWFNETRATAIKEMRLSYQPLLEQYRVTIGGLSRTFTSLREALNLIGYIGSWHIASADVLEGSGRKNLIFMFILDHQRLPRIFQLGSASEDEWRLSMSQEVDLDVSLQGADRE